MKVPHANKTRMVRLLRRFGFDVPNSRRAQFSKYKTSYWLDYEDSSGAWHKATYSSAGGRAFLMVDQQSQRVPMEVVVELGLYRIKPERRTQHGRSEAHPG